MRHYWHPVVSTPRLHFTEALAQDGVSVNYNLPLPFAGPILVRAQRIISMQNLTYELWLFESAVNLAGALGADRFIAPWQFGIMVAGPPASPGYASGADPYFRFYTEGFETPYTDMDFVPVAGGSGIPYLHVRLVCRSAVGKLAYNAGGDLQVAFLVTPQGVQA